MLNAHRFKNYNFDGKCILYKQTRSKEYVSIENTKLLIDDMIDYGSSSKIFSTNKDIIIKMSYARDNEIYSLQQARTFLHENKTFHFIGFYGFSKCNKIKLSPSTESQHSVVVDSIAHFYDSFYLIFFERFDINMMDLMENKTFDNDPYKMKSMYAQAILAIASFHYFLRGVHDDTTTKNFFIKFQNDYQPNMFIHYKLYGEDIYIPYCGFIVVIADYGNSFFEDVNEHKLLKDYALILDAKPLKKLLRIDDLDVLEFKTVKNLMGYLKPNLFQNELNQYSTIINKEPYYIY